MIRDGNHMNESLEKKDSKFSAALSLYKANEYDQAISLLNQIIKSDPDYIDAYVLKGVIHQTNKDLVVAEKSFRDALQIAPNYTIALQAFGLFLVSQKRYREAIPYLEKHLEINPDDQMSLDGIIKAFTALPDRKNDILNLLKQVWVHSKSPEIGLRYALKLTKNFEKENAYHIYKQVLEISKKPKSLTDYALSCYFFFDYDEAINLLKKAITMDSSYERAWRVLTECYIETEQPLKALESVEKAISLDPKDYQKWRMKADVFIQTKDFHRALKYAEKGIELMSQESHILNSISKTEKGPFFQKIFILNMLGKVEEALEFADFARNIAPQNQHFYLYPIQMLIDMGRPDEALDLLENSKGIESEEWYDSIRYYLLHKSGQYRKSSDYLKKSVGIEKKEKIGDIADLGKNIYSKGDRQDAISIYRQLLSIDRENPQIKNDLGCMLLGVGVFDEAESLFRDVENKFVSQFQSFISKYNLAYLYTLQSNKGLGEAIELLDEIFRCEFEDEKATLLVPFWFQGKVYSDPAQFPGRNVFLGQAANACGLTCNLALGDLESGNLYIKDMVKGEYHDPLPLISLGTFEAECNNIEKVKEYWHYAIDLSQNTNEKNILKKWLAMLK